MPEHDQNTDPTTEDSTLPQLGVDLPHAMDLLGIFSPVLDQAYSRSAEVDEERFGDRATKLSPEEQYNLSSLRDEFAALSQPIEQKRAIGQHIPGNEFSVSLQGFSQGMNDMLASIEGKRRTQRLFGDPERRKEVEQTISKTQQEIEKLRENAENIRNGLIPANELAKIHPMADADEVAASVDEQAEALEQEIQVYQKQLDQYSGVSSRLDEAEKREEEVERNRAFREEFVNTFGTDMYDRALKTIQQREGWNNQRDLERFRQRAQDRRNRLSNRARMRASGRSDIEDDGLPNEVNVKWIGGLLEDYRQGVEQEFEDFKNMYAQTNTMGDEEFNIDMLPQEDRLLYQRYQDELRYLNDIEVARSFWDDPEFDKSQIPEFRHPSPGEEAKLTAMREMGMPFELIRAYKYYNFLDFNALPIVPDEARVIDSSETSRPFRFFNWDAWPAERVHPESDN